MASFIGRGKIFLLGALVFALILPGAAVAQGPSEEPSKASKEAKSSKVDEDPDGNPYVAGELIVTYEEKASAKTKESANSEAGAQVEEEIPEIDAAVVSVPEVKDEPSKETRKEKLKRKKETLEADPNVEAVDYNYLKKKLATPNDPLYGQQWGLTKIKAPQAHDTTKGSGAKIAIVDGGAQATHADLNGSVVGAYDYYNGDATPNDEDGHGTHVSGIAAARANNSKGIAGTAPEAALLNYDVCGQTYCDDAAIMSAIGDAANAGADVINMSLGGGGRSTAEQNAVNNAWNKGVVLVAAAGNEAQQGNPVSYPAAYANVIAVGSTTSSDNRSSFSNYGSYVDVAAPGSGILSSVPTSVSSSGYASWSGTSMATPFVSGLAALLASQGLTNAQIEQRITGTATDLGSAGKDVYYGHGLINTYAAVASGGGGGGTGNTAPTVTPVTPAPNSYTTNRRPTIQATVSDAQSALSKANVKLYVDGYQETSFSYTGNRLSYTPYYKMSRSEHEVEVVATDPQGLATTQSWTFTVRR